MFRLLGPKLSTSSPGAAAATSFLHNLGFYRFCSKGSLGALGNECSHGFTVSYLLNSCGMPLDTALVVASKVNFKTPEKPDLILSFLQSQGFSKAQILNTLKRFPRLLCYDSDKHILPKFEFLYSIGLSKSECLQVVYACPSILTRSLERRIIPNYNCLKSVLVEDQKVIKCLKRSHWILLHNLPEKLPANIAYLRSSGVSEVLISYLVTNFPDVASHKHSKFCSIVNQVRDMGFDPSKYGFAEAIRVLYQMTSSTFERKFEVYRKCGWSKDQTLLAFKKFPQCLSLSEEKISKSMDFFVHKMRLKPENIAARPTVMSYNLVKRIIPRYSVVQSLYSKGLLKEKLGVYSILQPSEKTFLEKYVAKFPEHVTWLSRVYAGEIKVFDV